MGKGRKDKKLARFDLIPVRGLWELAQVYGHGAEKYGDHNWRSGYEWSRSYAALQRHLNLFWSGESVDKESGRHHLAHAIFHCLTLFEWEHTASFYDDRGETVTLLTEVTEKESNTTSITGDSDSTEEKFVEYLREMSKEQPNYKLDPYLTKVWGV